MLSVLIDRVYRALVDGVTDRTLEEQLAQRAADRWENIELPQMSTFDADKTKELFREKVMTSLRDVDEAVRFGSMPQSGRIYDALI